MSKLIMCPGCDHVYNEEELINNCCPRCGLSFDNHELVKELEKIYLCPFCGDVFTNTSARNNNHMCKYCSKELIQIDMTLKENTDFILKDGTTVKDQTRIIANKYGNFQFSDSAYDRRMNIVKSKQSGMEVSNSSSKPQSVPHCPTCGSTNIKRISIASKAVGAGLFGLFSKTAKSQFECKNCGYTW